MGISAGILIILLSFAHIIYGEKKQIAALKNVTDNKILIGSFRVMSYQGGLLLFAVGIIQVSSSAGLITLSGLAVYFPLFIIILNLVTFLFVALSKHSELLSISIPQLIIFSIIITLQILSIKL